MNQTGRRLLLAIGFGLALLGSVGFTMLASPNKSMAAGGSGLGSFSQVTIQSQQEYWMSCGANCPRAFSDGPTGWKVLTKDTALLFSNPDSQVLNTTEYTTLSNKDENYYKAYKVWEDLALVRQQSIENHWYNLLQRLGGVEGNNPTQGGTGVINDLKDVIAKSSAGKDYAGIYFQFKAAPAAATGTTGSSSTTTDTTTTTPARTGGITLTSGGKTMFDQYLIGNQLGSPVESCNGKWVISAIANVFTQGNMCADIADIDQQGYILGQIYTVMHSKKGTGGYWRNDLGQVLTHFPVAALHRLNQSGTYSTILKPYNLTATLTNGEAPAFQAEGHEGLQNYVGLDDFYIDYSQVRSLVFDIQRQVTADGGADPAALTTTLTAAGEQLAATSNDAQTNAPDSSGPCGKSDYIWNVSYNALKQLCGLSIFTHDMATRLLIEGSTWLAYTGDVLPRPADNASISASFIFNRNFLQFLSTPVEEDLLNQNPGTVGVFVRDAYNRVLQFLNVILVLGLIFIAIANLLQVQLNTYAINKMIPPLIIGFIVAHFSFFAFRASLELVGQAARGLVGLGVSQQQDGTGTPFDRFVNQFNGFPMTATQIAQTGAAAGCAATDSQAWMTENCSPDSKVSMTKVFKLTLLNVFIFTAAVAILIVAWNLLLRRFIFYAMVPFAPLATLGAFFSPLETVTKKWWSFVRGWMIMPIVTGFWLWLAMLWASSSTSVAADGTLAPILGYIFGIICLVFAIRAPFALAGEAKSLMESWNKFGRNQARRYTPAGSIARGYERIKANNAEKEKQIMQGPVIKGTKGKIGPGRIINERFARMDHRTKQNGERQAADEKLINAMAKDHDVRYQRRQAALDKLNENIESLEEIVKDTIKREKNLHHRQDALPLRELNLGFRRFGRDLSMRQMDVHADMQLSEVDKMVGWNRALEGEHALMRKVLAAGKSDEAIKKAGTEMEFKHISNRVATMGLHQNLNDVLAQLDDATLTAPQRDTLRDRAVDMATRLEDLSNRTEDPEKAEQYRALSADLATAHTVTAAQRGVLRTRADLIQRRLTTIDASAEAIIDKRLAKAGGADDKEEGGRMLEEPTDIIKAFGRRDNILNFARLSSGRIDEITNEKERRNAIAAQNALKRLTQTGRASTDLGNEYLARVDAIDAAVAAGSSDQAVLDARENFRRAGLLRGGALRSTAAAGAPPTPGSIEAAFSQNQARDQARDFKTLFADQTIARAIQFGDDLVGKPGVLYTDQDVTTT